VSRAKRETLLAALEKGLDPAQAIASVADRPGAAPLEALRFQIDRCFAGLSVEEILAWLEMDGSEWARQTIATISGKSPTSLKLAFHQLREGAKLEFDDCMRMEFRMVNRVIDGHDFYEGVRATIIDKDGAPKWRPDSLAAVSEADIDAYFAPLKKELPLG
jgi:enoyl-CoA hydratase